MAPHKSMTPSVTSPTAPRYTLQTRMSDIVSGNFSLLLLFTRFGIPLGFGERTLAQVCLQHGVDAKTLLLLLNYTGRSTVPSVEELSQICLEELIGYLSKSHIYFLEFRLPQIRERLFSAISGCPTELEKAIHHFFDEYVEEVHNHMRYEDRTVFPYARRLAMGDTDQSYNISIFSKRHDQIELKISELKNLLIKYYESPSGYELCSVLYDIFSSEVDLAAHNEIEDYIFIPYIHALEQGQIPR